MEGRKRLHHLNDSAILVEINQVEWNAHIGLGHSPERCHPESLARLERELSEQVLEAGKRKVGGLDL
jgi:hypothetical protein